MKGFKIICHSKKGEDSLLNNIKKNSKVFNVVKVGEEPFLDMNFLFRSNLEGRMFKKAMMMVPVQEQARHISRAMEDLGAKQEEDFEVQVII